MSKPILLSEQNWAKLYNQLTRDNPPSVLLIREKMKVVLGFTVRRHTEWVLEPGANHRYPEKCICLDFYNEPKRTMFLLKYSSFLDNSGKTDS